MRRARHNRAILWIAAFGVPLLIGYAVAALLLFPAPIFATTKSVPHVLGMPLERARTALEEAGFDIGNVETAPHPTAPRGSVVWQDPPADVGMPEGTAVNLSVSSGPQRVPVPDLTGYEAPLAQRMIEAAGLDVGGIDSAQAPVPRGVVVNTRPPAGAALNPGTRVMLVVSLGAPTITVPNLVGLTLDEAKAVLAEVGLQLGTSMLHTSLSSAPGTIIEQRPGANTLAAPSTPIDVTVARLPT